MYSMDTAPNPREVLELARVILEMEENLTALRAQWNAMFTASVEVKEPKANGRPTSDNSVSAKVLAMINSDPLQHWDTESMTSKLGAERYTVASALYNLYIARKIARHSRGKYEAIMPGVEQNLYIEKEGNAA